MKIVLLALGLSLVAADAQAVSRYDPTRMSCGQVRASIAREGAVILRYRSPRNPNLPLFDRYVRGDRFCAAGEFADRASVPSADRRACPVLKCKKVEFDDRRRPLWFRN